jgi:hypothetical protein
MAPVRALRAILLAGALLGALGAPRRLKQAQAATGLTPCIGEAFPLLLPNITSTASSGFVRALREGEAEGEADAPDIADVLTFATWSPQGAPTPPPASRRHPPRPGPRRSLAATPLPPPQSRRRGRSSTAAAR